MLKNIIKGKKGNLLNYNYNILSNSNNSQFQNLKLIKFSEFSFTRKQIDKKELINEMHNLLLNKKQGELNSQKTENINTQMQIPKIDLEDFIKNIQGSQEAGISNEINKFNNEKFYFDVFSELKEKNFPIEFLDKSLKLIELNYPNFNSDKSTSFRFLILLQQILNEKDLDLEFYRNTYGDNFINNAFGHLKEIFEDNFFHFNNTKENLLRNNILYFLIINKGEFSDILFKLSKLNENLKTNLTKILNLKLKKIQNPKLINTNLNVKNFNECEDNNKYAPHEIINDYSFKYRTLDAKRDLYNKLIEQKQNINKMRYLIDSKNKFISEKNKEENLNLEELIKMISLYLLKDSKDILNEDLLKIYEQYQTSEKLIEENVSFLTNLKILSYNKITSVNLQHIFNPLFSGEENLSIQFSKIAQKFGVKNADNLLKLFCEDLNSNNIIILKNVFNMNENLNKLNNNNNNNSFSIKDIFFNYIYFEEDKFDYIKIIDNVNFTKTLNKTPINIKIDEKKFFDELKFSLQNIGRFKRMAADVRKEKRPNFEGNTNIKTNKLEKKENVKNTQKFTISDLKINLEDKSEIIKDILNKKSTESIKAQSPNQSKTQKINKFEKISIKEKLDVNAEKNKIQEKYDNKPKENIKNVNEKTRDDNLNENNSQMKKEKVELKENENVSKKPQEKVGVIENKLKKIEEKVATIKSNKKNNEEKVDLKTTVEKKTEEKIYLKETVEKKTEEKVEIKKKVEEKVQEKEEPIQKKPEEKIELKETVEKKIEEKVQVKEEPIQKRPEEKLEVKENPIQKKSEEKETVEKKTEEKVEIKEQVEKIPEEKVQVKEEPIQKKNEEKIELKETVEKKPEEIIESKISQQKPEGTLKKVDKEQKEQPTQKTHTEEKNDIKIEKKLKEENTTQEVKTENLNINTTIAESQNTETTAENKEQNQEVTNNSSNTHISMEEKFKRQKSKKFYFNDKKDYSTLIKSNKKYFTSTSSTSKFTKDDIDLEKELLELGEVEEKEYYKKETEVNKPKIPNQRFSLISPNKDEDNYNDNHNDINKYNKYSKDKKQGKTEFENENEKSEKSRISLSLEKTKNFDEPRNYLDNIIKSKSKTSSLNSYKNKERENKLSYNSYKSKLGLKDKRQINSMEEEEEKEFTILNILEEEDKIKNKTLKEENIEIIIETNNEISEFGNYYWLKLKADLNINFNSYLNQTTKLKVEESMREKCELHFIRFLKTNKNNEIRIRNFIESVNSSNFNAIMYPIDITQILFDLFVESINLFEVNLGYSVKYIN
jgi:hypothetical protein